MDGIADAARGCGYPPERLHQEFFNREVETGGASFTVEVPELGLTVAVGEDETIVAALQKRGSRSKSPANRGSAEPVSPMCAAACRITATSI
jgi:vanillate O-demethylase ferredoxin subunit